jgi:2-dehydropantoate 2-reductase
MENHDNPVIGIVGAGAVGCFMAAMLHHAGYEIRLVLSKSARSAQWHEVLCRQGLVAKCSLETAFHREISAGDIHAKIGADPMVLKQCSCVLVTTKRGANENIQQQLNTLGVRCPVVFLQNGLNIKLDLSKPIHFEAIESVVDFNVTQDMSSGIITLAQSLDEAHLILDGAQPSATWLADHLNRSAIKTSVSESFVAVQRGKLLLNMTNAVNALSGLPIGPMFYDPAYRRILAASIEEAKSVFGADGVHPMADNSKDEFLLRWFTSILLSPQWFFSMTMGRKLKGRGEGRTSMAQDLEARRVPTEVGFLNGEIVRLGQAAQIPTPVNQKILELVEEAETRNQGSPGLSSEELLQLAGLNLRNADRRGRCWLCRPATVARQRSSF